MDPKDTGFQYDILAYEWQHSQRISSYGMAALHKAIQFTSHRKVAIDIGCGSNGRFIDEFIKEGFQAEGLDVSEKMIYYARELHPNATFYHCDISNWNFSKKYSLITAWDSTFHLPLDLQEPVLRKLCQALESQGILLFSCGGSIEESEIIGSFSGLTFEYSSLGIHKNVNILMEENCVLQHLEYDQYPANHVYIIVQKQSKK